MKSGSIILAAAALCFASPATAAPLAGTLASDAGGTVVTPVQYGIYFGYGRPYRSYDPYYGPSYRPYYRPYGGYYREPLPPATYYETRPYRAAPPPPSGDPDALARCASRFRSFNANTGTYTTYDGEERLCPYLR